jgi:sugar (pentulose or hexulose) kinase
MDNRYILSIDCGSQSIKAMIFDTKGNLVCKAQKAFLPYEAKYPNWAEADADMFWQYLCMVTKELKANHVEQFDKIAGVSLTTQRDTVVFLDKQNNLVRPTILWMDKRKQKDHKPITFVHTVAMKIVSMYRTAVAVNKACPAHWVQKNQPEIWKKTHKYVLLSGYLNYKLTGILKDNSANQIGHIPFNYKKSIWESKYGMKRQMFQIEREKLIELTEPATVFGKISEQAAKESGLPCNMAYIPSGSDKGCETLGTGCFTEEMAAISLGSQASVQITSDRYFETIPFVPPFPSVVPKKYNPEIQINKGFWMISWFKNEFAKKDVDKAQKMGIVAEELLNQSLKDIPIGSEGLMLQPYWGSVLENPEARGAMIGFSDVHTRYHIYRAIIEGIGFALKDGIKAIEKKSKVGIEKIMISGGGSISDEICQISADVFGKQVCKVQTYETSGLGCAIVGFKALNIYTCFEEAVSKMVHETKSFEPNKEANKKYEKIYSRIYKKMYRNLKPMYDEMYEIYEH